MEGKGVKWHGAIKETIQVPIDKAWEIGGNFCAVDKWLEIVVRCDKTEGEYQKPGCVRHVIGETTWAKEKLLSIDEDNYSMSYSVLDNNMGLVGYVAQFKLQDLKDGTILVDWSYETDPAENQTEEQLAATFTSIFKGGVTSLEDIFKSQSSS